MYHGHFLVRVFRLRGVEAGVIELDKLRGCLGLNIPCMLWVAMVRVVDGLA